MTASVWSIAESMMAPAADSLDDTERREEQSMLVRCASGDEIAVRWVVKRYRHRVVGIAARVLRNPRDAEDVAQEAFVKAFRQIAQFRGDSRFYVWLYRIVVNLCLDRLRRKSASSELPLEDAMPTPVSITPDIDTRLAVEQVLDSLSPPMRAALVLRDVEGLDYLEIAMVLGIPLGTVRSRLHSARKEFRRRWTELLQETNKI